MQAHLQHGVQAARRTIALCDTDGTALERRADDDELTVRRRLALYREQTAPLEAFYRERDLLKEIDAEVREGEVADRVRTTRWRIAP